MREGLWRTKKGVQNNSPKHVNKSQNITKNHQTSKHVKKWNMGGGRGGAQRCASNFSLVTMAEMVRKSKKCRFGASEIVSRPVNICTMRRICTRTRFRSREPTNYLKIARFWQKSCPILFRKNITIQNRSPPVQGGSSIKSLVSLGGMVRGVSANDVGA